VEKIKTDHPLHRFSDQLKTFFGPLGALGRFTPRRVCPFLCLSAGKTRRFDTTPPRSRLWAARPENDPVTMGATIAGK